MHRKLPFLLACLTLLLALHFPAAATPAGTPAGSAQGASSAVAQPPSSASSERVPDEGNGALLPPSPEQILWQITTVDSAGNVGQYTSLRRDSAGRPRISYYDVTQGALKYAAFNGSAWATEVVETTANTGLYTSLALNSAGTPHISYCDITNGNLRYAHYVGTGGNCGVTHPGAWQCDTVDSAGNVGEYSSLELDTAGYPHISYFDATNLDLKYAYLDGSAWQISTVDSTGSVGSYTSLVLDLLGLPRISYYDGTQPLSGDLKYAHYVGDDNGNCGPTNSWQCITIASLGLQGLHSSITVDDSDQTHISYYGQSSLRYAHEVGAGGNCVGNTWYCETIVNIGNGEDYGQTSLALDRNNEPHISYCRGTQIELGYAHRVVSGGNCGVTDPGAWSCEPVDPAADTGPFSSLALDGQDLPGISYYDLALGDLKYAEGPPCRPLESVAISGPTFLRVGEVGTYDAATLPPQATLPVTITWDSGTVGATATYSWPAPGLYTITVTATNPCGVVVTDTLAVSVCQPLAAVEIAGPAFLQVGEVGTYTATWQPPTATLPVTITWDNGTVGSTATYSWSTPGLYTITVTATNPCSTVTDTHRVTVAEACRPLSSAAANGPPLLRVGETGWYTASYEPPTATLPVDYTWDNGTVGDTAAYSWTTPGPQAITVTAVNPCNVVTGSLAVTVCQPVTAVPISGPVFLEAGQVGTYTASYLPPTATLPVTLTWDGGTVGLTAYYSWTTSGVYTITVTATNPCTVITGTFTVAVAVCEPVATAAITGPAFLTVGQVGIYTATHAPDWATPPFTATWDNGTLGSTAAYSWTTDGDHFLTVTVANACGQANAMFTASVCQPVQGVDFTWAPTPPLAERSVFFTATAAGTAPISYTWDVAGITLTGPLVVYTFTAPGSYPVSLLATNGCGQEMASHTLFVQRPRAQTIHLPLVFRGWNACHLKGGSFWEVEPNGSFTDANGPLCSGPTYYGYADDPNDYFSFLSGTGPGSIRVGNPGGCAMQILLYCPPAPYWWCGWGNSCDPVLTITRELTQTGNYYLRVYAAVVLTQPYTVQVTFPQP